MNILIRNLPRSMTEREMLGLFLPFGKVRAHNLVFEPESGKSKGFGFIDMPNHDDAVAAITALNNTTIGGLKIRVKVTAQKYEPPAAHAARPRPARAEQRIPGEHRRPQSPRKTDGRTGARPQRSEYNNPMRSSQSPPEGSGQSQWVDRSSGRPSGGNSARSARSARGAQRSGTRPQRSEYNNLMGSSQVRSEGSSQTQWTDRPSGRPSGGNAARSAGGPKRTGARPQRNEYNNPMGSSQARSGGNSQTQWTDRSSRPVRSGRPSGGNAARPAGKPKHPGATGDRQTRPRQKNKRS